MSTRSTSTTRPRSSPRYRTGRCRPSSRARSGAPTRRCANPARIYDASVRKIIVHHTGTPNDITDYAGLCRGILANETSDVYIDIAYNWLIDPQGRIYEGRWAQNYPAGASHTGELNGANVRGAHAINNNSNTIGVALMGTYDTVDPPPAMVNALVTLLAWKCARWGIDPIGFGAFLATNGVVENIYNICGHRDTSSTDCPGQLVEPMLPAIRVQVASRISGTGYWIATDTAEVLAFGGAPLAHHPGIPGLEPDRRHLRPSDARAATGCSAPTAASTHSVPPPSTGA